MRVKSQVQTSISSTARFTGLALVALFGFFAVVGAALFALAMTLVMLAPKTAIRSGLRERHAEARAERTVTAATAQ